MAFSAYHNFGLLKGSVMYYDTPLGLTARSEKEKTIQGLNSMIDLYQKYCVYTTFQYKCIIKKNANLQFGMIKSDPQFYYQYILFN